jgi:4-hydroxybenzoate polyprenyltransferase
MNLVKCAAYVQLARPYQYIKNGFIFLPIFFGHKLYDYQALLTTFWAFVVFCLAASSIYVINDIHDIEADRQHPVKKLRPLAAGVLSKPTAWLLSVILFTLALIISLTFLERIFLLPLGAYLMLNLAYSYTLKNLAIIDVSCIALGFVFRVFAGGIAAKVWPSHWLILMTFLLALFLSFAKRRDDLILAEGGHNVRRSINNYNLEFISLSMVVLAAVIIVSYALYTVSPEVVSKHGTNNLYLTTIWVIVGVLRYMQITFVEQKSGYPTLILFRDYFMQGVIVLWIISVYLIIYLFDH